MERNQGWMVGRECNSNIYKLFFKQKKKKIFLIKKKKFPSILWLCLGFCSSSASWHGWPGLHIPVLQPHFSAFAPEKSNHTKRVSVSWTQHAFSHLLLSTQTTLWTHCSTVSRKHLSAHTWTHTHTHPWGWLICVLLLSSPLRCSFLRQPSLTPQVWGKPSPMCSHSAQC